MGSITVSGAGFPTGVENIGRGRGGGSLQNLMGGLKSIHGGEHAGFKMLSKNTCEGVNLIVKLPDIGLQACKFTKNELFHTHISRILARF